MVGVKANPGAGEETYRRRESKKLLGKTKKMWKTFVGGNTTRGHGVAGNEDKGRTKHS